MKKILTLFFLSTALLSSCSTQPSSTYKDGEFFSLKELYESKVLTSDDLLNISYYNNNHKVYDKNDNLIDESTYTIKELDSLSREDEDNIINNYKDVLLDKYQDNSEIKNNIERLEIAQYCGIYHDYYAIRFNNLLDGATAIEKDVVGEYTFYYPTLNGEKVQLFKYNEWCKLL